MTRWSRLAIGAAGRLLSRETRSGTAAGCTRARAGAAVRVGLAHGPARLAAIACADRRVGETVRLGRLRVGGTSIAAGAGRGGATACSPDHDRAQHHCERAMKRATPHRPPVDKPTLTRFGT